VVGVDAFTDYYPRSVKEANIEEAQKQPCLSLVELDLAEGALAPLVAEVDGVYTNKPPGGVAYRCSFRVTEAVHAIERMVDILAHDVGKDPAQLRLDNFIKPEQFPYKTPTGWEYDSGDYGRALKMAMDIIGYDELRKEQAEKRTRGEWSERVREAPDRESGSDRRRALFRNGRCHQQRLLEGP